MPTTRERILAAIDTLDENQLEEILQTLQHLTDQAHSQTDNSQTDKGTATGANIPLGANLAEDFRILRRALAEEDLDWSLPTRDDDRVNPFLEDLDGEDDIPTD